MADPERSVAGDGVPADPSPGLLATASVVSIHKLAHLGGSLVSVALLPRLLGVEDFGRFAFVMSLSYLGQIAGDFGTLDVLNHFVPAAAGDARSRLYTRTLAFKLAVAPLCGAATAVTALLLADWLRWTWALAAGIGVALHIVAWVPFQYALAERRVGAWMTEQSWRQWITLGGIVVLYPAAGFAGVLAAMVASEALFCGAGLRWAAHAWRRAELRLDPAYLTPYLRFGGGFFVANIATVVLYRSGPALVGALTSDPLQTGIIELALGVYLVAYVSISQFAQSMLPVLSTSWQRGDRGELQRWLGGFVRVAAPVAIVAAATAWLIAGRVAPLVFGAAFATAATAIEVIALAMPAAVLAWAGNVLATACGRGNARLAAALAATVTFLPVVVVLAPVAGAVGAAAAVVVSVSVHATVLWWLLRRECDLVACLTGRSRSSGPGPGGTG